MNDALHIRDIDARSGDEIDLVAARMRATLVEVEGEDGAARLHSPPWIRERLLWHVSNAETPSRVLVAAWPDGRVVGHTILRRDVDAAGRPVGFVSTTYVVPEARRHGIAQRLLEAGEAWFRALGLTRASTWTSATNAPLIGLYRRHGYAITDQGPNDVTGTLMVNLTRALEPAPGSADR